MNAKLVLVVNTGAFQAEVACESEATLRQVEAALWKLTEGSFTIETHYPNGDIDHQHYDAATDSGGSCFIEAIEA